MNGGEEQSFADSRFVRDYFETLEYLEYLEYWDASKVSKIYSVSGASKKWTEERGADLYPISLCDNFKSR